MNHFRLYRYLSWVVCPLWSAGSCLFFLSPSYGQTPELSPLESGPPATFSPLTPPPVPAQPPDIADPLDNSFNLYRLNVGDTIAGVVEGFPEFNFRSPVDSQGNIIVPILGRVAAAGLTLEELEAKVSFELGRRFLQEGPPVIVRVEGARPVQVTLVGEIVRPGFYALPPNGELLALLNSAGGSTAEADLRNIIVRRPLSDGTVLERSFNLYTPLQNGDSPPSIPLQGGDTVIVRRLEVGTEQDYDRFLVSRTTLAQQQIIVRVVSPVGTGSALRNLTLPNGSTFLDVVASLPADDGLFLNRDDVALLRFDSERGQIVSQSLNADNAIKGDIAQDVPLRDGDAIIVSRTLIGKIFNVIRIVTRPIVDIFSFTRIIEDIAEGDFGRGGRRF